MNLSSLDLNLLWTLHVVLEEGTVAGAAARLGVTSPAVSNALSRLRASLDDPLLVRAGRKLVPTPLAAELKPELEAIFWSLERLLDKSEPFRPMFEEREFTIALSDADQMSFAPRIAELFVQEFPRSVLHVVSIDTLVAEGGLGTSTAELSIGPPVDSPDIWQRKLFEEEAAFVVRADHPLLSEPVPVDAFGRARHVDVRSSSGRTGEGSWHATDTMADQGFIRHVVLTVPGFVPAIMVAASTDLVAAVPRRLAEGLAARFELVILDEALPRVSFEMMMAWHERTHADGASAYFRELVARAVRSVNGGAAGEGQEGG